MLERIKYKHLHDDIYSYYVDILDYDLNLIDKLYLEFRYKYLLGLDYYYYDYKYTKKYMRRIYGINIDATFTKYSNGNNYKQNTIIYDDKEYLILTNLIINDNGKNNYLNQKRKAKLKNII